MLDYSWSHNPLTYRRTVTPNCYWTHTVPKFGLQSSWIIGACHYFPCLITISPICQPPINRDKKWPMYANVASIQNITTVSDHINLVKRRSLTFNYNWMIPLIVYVFRIFLLIPDIGKVWKTKINRTIAYILTLPFQEYFNGRNFCCFCELRTFRESSLLGKRYFANLQNSNKVAICKSLFWISNRLF